MAETVQLVRVFVSSPGDVKAERAALDEVLQRINETVDPGKRVRLELWKWERGVVPQIGPGPQAAVDTQTPRYDVYLGIMAQRFGTPTGPYGSGTEKEFRDAVKWWKKVGRPWILFYFDDTPVPPSQFDPKEYPRVAAFREEVSRLGLYATYRKVDGNVRGGEDAFSDQVEQHLRRVLQQLPSSRPRPGRATRGTVPRVKGPGVGPPAVSSSYRTWLQSQCAELEFQGLKLKHGQAVRLNHVYVPLRTWAPGERRGRLLRRVELRPLLNVLGEGSLYVSGVPGSGKSMFCRWVAWLACAGGIPPHEIEAPEGYAEVLDASLKDRLPLLVRLRDFWAFLPDTPGLHELSRAELEAVFGAWVGVKKLPGLAWPDVRAHIVRGSALLILDGVDEVPLSVGEEHHACHPRSLLLAGLTVAVPEWLKAGNRVLVTSRPYGLTNAEARRLGITQASVEALADEGQALLAQRWFNVLADERGAAEVTAAEMLDHVREREWLEPLTANPMLLTAMCVVYSEGKRLPQDKHELYARIVDNVLHNRYAADPKAIDLVRSRLSVVAHGMHTGEGLGEPRSTPQAEATYDELDRMIQAYRDQSKWTEPGFKDVVATREDLLSQSGLLLPRDDRRAGFYHLSFQDFLVAERLADLDSARLPEVFEARAAAPEWRPALSFAFGSVLARNTSPERCVRLVAQLVERARADAYGLQVVIGECVEVLLGRGIHLQPADEERVRTFCLAAIDLEAPLPERHALGLTLGWLGDPRIVADLRDRSAYVEIAAGNYVLGNNRRRFTLKRPLSMARYSVTNSQYALFVGEAGYENDRWWSEGGRRWRDKSGDGEPRRWQGSRGNNPSQPVGVVSFWEAEAFCTWAGGRLPTAAEWECAARGPEGFDYPWGDAWEDGICNSREAKLGNASAVGLFPRSRSKPFSLEDMAGNVLEWCSASRASTQSREIRAVVYGGSWAGEATEARSASHAKFPPGIRFVNVGFRVVGPAA